MSKAIKQEWIDIIGKAEQILMRIDSDAFYDDDHHLGDVSSMAATACSKVIDLIDIEHRIYDLETDTFTPLFVPVIPPYDE